MQEIVGSVEGVSADAHLPTSLHDPEDQATPQRNRARSRRGGGKVHKEEPYCKTLLNRMHLLLLIQQGRSRLGQVQKAGKVLVKVRSIGEYE